MTSDLSHNSQAARGDFLRSKYFYISLVIAFSGAQIDWVLTAFGLVMGFSETRPFFWLHAVSLFAVIMIIYGLFYCKHPRTTNYLTLAFAVASPAIPVVSNVIVLVGGKSPFL